MSTTFEMQLTSLLYSLRDQTNFGTASLSSTEIFILTSPELVLLLGAVGLLLTKAPALTFLRNAYFTVSSTVLLVLWSIGTLINISEGAFNWSAGITFFDSAYSISFATQVCKLLLLLIGMMVLGLINSLNRQLVVLMLLTLGLGCVLFSTSSFVVLLLALEGMSLALYIMATTPQTHGSVTATVKYFAYGTLGSIFLLWGVVHLYIIIPITSYRAVQFLVENAHASSCPDLLLPLEFATTSLLVGFLVKLGAAPLHAWVADVYAGVHFTVMMFFATAVKFVLFVLFLRIAFLTSSSLLIDLSAMLSLLLGCYLALQQTEIRRFVAYSSIVHVAFLLMGDVPSTLMYLLTYVVSGLLFFVIVANVRVNGNELIYLSDLHHLRQISSFHPLLVAVALISTAGLPPFAGFFGKFAIWISLLEDIYLFNSPVTYLLLTVSISVSLVTIFYYVRLITYLFVGADSPLRGVMIVSQPYGLWMKICCGVATVFWTLLQPTVAELMLEVGASLLNL